MKEILHDAALEEPPLMTMRGSSLRHRRREGNGTTKRPQHWRKRQEVRWTLQHQRPGRAVRSRIGSVRQNAANSFESFPIVMIRLAVNSAMTAQNSKGDLIFASLRINSKANCVFACVISRSLA